MLKRSLLLAALLFAALPFTNTKKPVAASVPETPVENAVFVADSTPLKFAVTVAPHLLDQPQNGRLFVIVSRSGQGEPRLSIGQTGMDAPPVFAHDVNDFTGGKTAIIDDAAAAFPVASLSHLPAGEYNIQALFDYNNDLKSVNAPGNLYSAVQRATLNPARGGTVKLELTEKVPPEQLPPDTESVKFIKIKSELLSKFHGRPIYLRAGIILPQDYDKEPSRKYPLRVHIGGYGTSYRSAQMLAHRADFQDATAPKMIVLQLDGDGPYGDCYQVNSDNNGPYGDALTQELIPYVEKQYRAIGEPHARVLDGGSTGGWVSLALQIFYPDFFNGTWSYCPDGVDFRGFQLVNIYQDKNAYVNQYGFERPSERDVTGEVRFTIRHECQMENVMGLGDSWTMSGEQWGAWNAVYGQRGADGRPKPLWNPKTGEIDSSVVEHWKKYDLRLVLEQNYQTLAPKLKGKIHVWVGDADSYFLNNAVHMLDDFLSKAQPSIEAKIFYGPGKGHCWLGLTERQMMEEMAKAVVSSQ